MSDPLVLVESRPDGVTLLRLNRPPLNPLSTALLRELEGIATGLAAGPTGARIRELLRATRRIAVLGIKTEAQDDHPAFYVPQFLAARGLEIVPVPVYYPDVKEILGRPVYRRLADIPGEVDLVDVFRRSADVAGHLEDLLAKRPRAV